MSKLLLCIDDDEDDLELFTDALTEIKSSIRCITALTGKQGLDYLRAIVPDWIFLDLNMPSMDGMEVLKEIRMQSHLKSVPIVIFSTSITDVNRLKREGATDFIVKPSRFPELCHLLQKFLLE